MAELPATGRPLPPIPIAKRRIARRLALDAATAQVIGALRARGQRAILLKGPALAGWLYDHHEGRSYVDVDLLVAPEQFQAAEAVLTELGYDYRLAGARAHEQVTHAHHWVREHPMRAAVDLHRSLYWTASGDCAAWLTLSRDTGVIVIGGVDVEVLGAAGRALVVALHAAQHGSETPKPLRDLERALEVVDAALWRDAAALARELGASEPFAAGLRLHPAGIALAGRLGLPTRASSELGLLVGSPPPTAVGFQRLAAAGSARAQLRIALEKLFPTPASLRLWKPLARRGAAGLITAYAWRPLWLVWKAPRGLHALARAARSSRP